MEEEGSAEAFEYLGRYQINEAKRLFNALEKAEIDFEAAFDDGSGSRSSLGSFGTESGVEVAVESAKRNEVNAIHTKLFGSALPTKPTGHAEAEKWFDQETLGELEERERLAQALGDVDAELQALIAEMLAVKEEIERGALSVRKLQEMEDGQDRNRARATGLLARKNELAALLEALD